MSDGDKKMVPVKRTFPKKLMLEVLWDDVGEIVRDEIVGKRRWADMHELIFALDGKLYRCSYDRGSTEQQDEGPWEHVETVECTEVERYEKVVQAYRAVLTEAAPAP
jgi:hypothetical protein